MDQPSGERSRAATIFNIAMMVVGGVALYLMLRHHGWTEFRAMLANVGWWFAVVLALELVSLCMDGAALHAFMRPEARMISYWRVLGSNMSGRAINVLTPGGALGEPMKLMLLSAHAPRARALSSLVLFNLSIAYVSVTFMLVGIPITLLALEVPDSVKVMVGIGLAVIIPAMIALGVVVRRGAVTTVVDILQRVRIIKVERATAWREKLVDVDKHIRELHKNRSAGTWKGILWVMGSKLVSWTSSITLITVVGVNVTPTLVLGFLSVGLLIGWISQIVPMGLGVQDGGNYALFGLLGATGPQGLLVAMLQRARSISVAILGLGVFAIMQILSRLSQAKIQRKIRELREQQATGDDAPATT
ncbi:MAG TPA: lysylphosphatidylglycerol synthase transmembrane domain-containing protein [Kofleriaceae bacterium]|nr:lysylphosphatidylglycerol synthase transmembrane domain-containing protein [Kofleriaceae bacterium]